MIFIINETNKNKSCLELTKKTLMTLFITGNYFSIDKTWKLIAFHYTNV